MGTHHTIITGDSRQMKALADRSIHLVITSPPYWQLKDYGTADQIGFHHSYENYINHLNLVWNECHRVLHDGCRLCINIGDQFARSVYYGRYKVIPIREEIIKFCETVGFDYMGAIIWQKMTTSNTTGGGVQMGSYPYPRNGILRLDYEFILLFKKPGTGPRPSREQKECSKMTAEEWNTFFTGHWNFAGAKQSNHIAVFPEELPRRLIKMFSFAGETILDPFAGSGTTSLAARNLLRHSVGYEINPEFIPVIRAKLEEPLNSATGHTFEYNVQKAIKHNFDKQIASLPYVFIDPHALDKKVNLKKFRFGTRIDQNLPSKREEFFTVKEVLSAVKLRLNNGVTIKLLGVREDPTVNGNAIVFLLDKLRGKRVFLRYDDLKYDEDRNLLCYLYLENRTFINAHLIKQRLVRPDDGIECKYSKKFSRLFEETKE